jgi:hypothetical protein
MGKASIRAALYLPAITVMRSNAEFKHFAARLAAHGKPYGVILGAVMRKLLIFYMGWSSIKRPMIRKGARSSSINNVIFVSKRLLDYRHVHINLWSTSLLV